MCQRTGEGQHREAGTHAWGISDPGFCMPTRDKRFSISSPSKSRNYRDGGKSIVHLFKEAGRSEDNGRMLWINRAVL